MGNRDTFDLLSLLADWLSAIGTVGAVIVALALARAQGRPSVRLTIGIYKILGDESHWSDGSDLVMLSVVNRGTHDIVINGLCWRIGIFKRQAFVQLPGSHALSARLPKRLGPSETANFIFSRKEFSVGAVPLRNALKGRPLFLRRVLAGVYLSTGEELVTRPGKDVLRIFDESGSSARAG